MKRLYCLVIFLTLTIFGFSQEFNSEINGTFELIPNAKISYPFNKVKVNPTEIYLFDSENIIQVLQIRENQGGNLYLVERISPAPSTEEEKERSTMNLKVEILDKGFISATLFGNKNHGSFQLKPITL